MTLRIVDPTPWRWEQLAPFAPAIGEHLQRLAAEFPDTGTAQSLQDDIFSGAKRLWLVLDGEELRSIVLTAEETVKGTGVRLVSVVGMAGADGPEAVPLLAEIEAWARSRGAQGMRVYGREGWRRLLKAQGYRFNSLTLGKTLA